MRVFVGTDDSQLVATKVLEYSIRKHASGPVEFHGMTADRMPVPRERKNRPRTGFSFCRFTIPQRCGYRGRALYLDADMLVLTDIAELWRIPFLDQTVLCTWQGEVPEAWRNNPSFKTGRHFAVMLLDCERLHWDVRDVVRGLDEDRYSYQQLMYDLCIVAPDAIDHRIPTEWNSLEQWVPGQTKNIHYTVVPTQPWKCRTNPAGQIWDQYLAEAIAAGAVTRDDIERGVEADYLHPDLLRFVGRTMAPVTKGVAKAKPPDPLPAEPAAQTILFFLQLVTDSDLLLPLLVEARRRPGVDTRLVVDDAILAKVPTLAHDLHRRGILFWRTNLQELQAGRGPSFDGVTHVVTATESTAGPHLAAHTLVRNAQRRGIPCVTLQHGFENVGLTWFDHVHTPANTTFRSDRILTWGRVPLHPQASAAARERSLPVGCWKELLPPRGRLQRPPARPGFVAVLENLHWHRFGNDYRQRFLHDLEQAVQSTPDTTWFVRPHPAGRYLTTHFRGELPQAPNLVIADPRDVQWRGWHGPELFAIADLVVTTPSTVALDVARCGVPVVVVGYGEDLAPYEPLPMVRAERDWVAFVQQAREPAGRARLLALGRQFLDRVVLPGDAPARAIDAVLSSSRVHPAEHDVLPRVGVLERVGRAVRAMFGAGG